MTAVKEEITICICTYKRAALLGDLLKKLWALKTDALFSYRVVVVDNDSEESARPVVESLQRQSPVPISYHVQPEQNIALTRNTAVENATGEYLAFIDDDEFPEEGWLLALYLALKKYDCAGVLGPVRPWFGAECPRWLVRANLVERKSHESGTVMDAHECRTGNVLMERRIFDDPDNRFERQYGRTGGEDVWFFVRVMAKGYRFVWCEEGPVHEIVTPERCKALYYIRRSVRMGGVSGEEVRTKGAPGRSFSLVFAAACAYLAFLPVAFLMGKHRFVRCLTKGAYHCSWLLGYLGHVPIRVRDD
ncbi:glycosyltransferase family 2 protein [Geomonas sp. RF6]|uniref:glycosyltransferase family 2 protein n=1 Tax=Geomonas sp. RF6 TaxID=2897342 RepID=UPI001E2DE73A|nr:glycosyltransferase family A protein [Geomonas sp. RF6]UFS71086.1 glycosyltransferase family 2 protein [Geomonas sp. RF6]